MFAKSQICKIVLFHLFGVGVNTFDFAFAESCCTCLLCRVFHSKASYECKWYIPLADLSFQAKEDSEGEIFLVAFDSFYQRRENTSHFCILFLAPKLLGSGLKPKSH